MQDTVHEKTHKHGIELPITVAEALEIDRKTNTALWMETIAKDLAVVKIDLKFNDHGEPVHVGHQCIPYHIVFDVKMDFARKARLVAGGHVT